jgi:hypothetical protein
VTTATNGFSRDARSAVEVYLQQGRAPIPLPSRSKKPVIDGWQNLRLTADTIDHHFPDGPPCNIGILTGTPSGGLIDIDLDAMEAVRAAPHLLPPTSMLSGRAGKPKSHYWYVVDDPPEKASEKYKDLIQQRNHQEDDEADEERCCLVELRSTGGQTVVPPSVHDRTGELLVWHSFGEPARVELEQLDKAVRRVAAAASIARYWPPVGVRHDLALGIAGGVLRAGWSVEEAEAFVEAVCVAAKTGKVDAKVKTVQGTKKKLDAGDEHVTGWTRAAELMGEHGRAVVRQVREWLAIAEPTAKAPPKPVPRLIEPYRPFPMATLPEPIRSYVRQAAGSLGCDPAFAALPVLAVVASAIGNARTIRLKLGWDEPSIVWSLIVGDSGTLKSPAWRKSVGHLFALQKRHFEEYKRERAKYEEDLADYQEKKRKAKHDGTNPGEPPVPPVQKRVVCSDITIERVAEILEDNPRGVLVTRDELSAWFGSFTRYKGKNGGSDLPNWLEIQHAGPIIYDRKTGDRRTIFVPRAVASVTGGIQPGVLIRTVTLEFLEAGLLGRFVLAMPPKKPKRWSEVGIHPDVDKAFRELLDDLLALNMDEDEGDDDEARAKVPHALRLTPDAKRVWVEFYNQWGDEQAAAEGEMAAAYSKLEAYAARFALLHHVVSRVARNEDDNDPIEPESVHAGIALCRWFAAEARRIYATLTESQQERDTRRLIEFIQARGGRISVRILRRSNDRKYPTSEHAEAALEGLVQANLGEWADVPPTAKGGRPTREFVLHPTPAKTAETSEPDADETVGPPAETPANTSPGSEIPRAPEGFGGFGDCQVKDQAPEQAPDRPGGFCQAHGEAPSGFGGHPPGALEEGADDDDLVEGDIP